MPELTIEIDDALYARLEQCAAEEGYSSVEEFVVHILEEALAKEEKPKAEAGGELSEEEVRKRLEKLGYM